MIADLDVDLSIIIVNWNTREMTLECLRSVYAQTHATRFEVLLVDNGSHDGSAEAIAQVFPQVRLLAESENHGFALANNLAAKQARGRRLLLLNSDTVVLNGAIDAIHAFAQTCPSARIWGGRTVFGDGSLNRTSAWAAQSLWSVTCFALGLTVLFPKSSFFNPEAMAAWRRDTVREVDIVTGCFLLIDTDMWRMLDGFDPTFFMYGEEADLCLRAKDIGARPMITPQATVVHYGGGSAVDRTDPMVRVLKGKITLAGRRENAVSHTAIRWLYLIAVLQRRVGFGLMAPFSDRARVLTRLWGETFSRRAEWF